jgi:hypothetical protein
MSAKHAEQTRLRKSSPAWRFQERCCGEARRRGKSLSLLTSEYEGLVVNGRCFYCHGRCGSGLLGIDRVDNSRGYHTGNCVACCARCNFMKGSLELGQFLIDQCAAITSNKGKMYDPEEVVPVHSSSKKRSFGESADTLCVSTRRTPTCPAREIPKTVDVLCVVASSVSKDAKHRWMKQWVRREGGWFRRTWVRR